MTEAARPDSVRRDDHMPLEECLVMSSRIVNKFRIPALNAKIIDSKEDFEQENLLVVKSSKEKMVKTASTDKKKIHSHLMKLLTNLKSCETKKVQNKSFRKLEIGKTFISFVKHFHLWNVFEQRFNVFR